jgi:hypothetical protein
MKQVIGLNFRAAFQSAGFIQDFDYNIDLHKKDSASSVLSTTLTFDSDSVVAVVSGVVNPANFTANPDAESTALNFYLQKPARVTQPAGTTQITVFHGATDAPTVSLTVPALGGAALITGLKYGQFQVAQISGNPALPTSLGTVMVNLNLPGGATYKSYLVPLAALDGKAVTVFASGFVDSAANQNGAAFRLFAGVPNSPFPSIVFLEDSDYFFVSLGSNQTVCSGDQITLQPTITFGTAPYTYSWQSSGSSLSCSNCANPTVNLTQSSTYSVTVTDFNGQTASSSISYTVSNCGGCNHPNTPSGQFYPDYNQFPCITYNQNFSNSVSFKVPTTITVPLQANIDSLEFVSISNLPCRLNAELNKVSKRYSKNELGCISISGTTNDAVGQYKLDIQAMVWLDGSSSPVGPVSIEIVGLVYYLKLINSGNSCPNVNTGLTGNTTSNNCSLLSVSLGSNQSVCSGTQVTLQPSVSNGTSPYTYSWQSLGNSLSCNNCSNPTATITQNSTYSVTVTDANSNTASATISYNIGATGTIQIQANGPTTFCNGGSVTLSVPQNYTSYAWSNGSTLSTITASQNGIYTVTVTNANGCVSTGSIAVNVVQGITSQPIIGNPSITPFQNYSYLVNAVSGITYSWSVQSGAIQSGQGSSNINVVWGSTGPYIVTLIQTNQAGCSDTSFLAVANSSCNLSVNVFTIGSPNVCQGDTILLVAQVASPATYQWYKNGVVISGQTDDTLFVTNSGSYQVQVVSGNCTVLSNSNNFTFNPSPASPAITVNTSGSCLTTSSTLSVPSNYQSYLWSNGGNSNSITVSNSGNYTVTVTGANGCKAVSQPYNLNLSFVSPSQVCVVSVDSATGKNMVVWEKPNKFGIDSFYIYKESNQFNVFNKIGAVDVNDFSVFVDNASNPQQQSDRYKIAVLDTCGVVALQSAPHKTIHLTINQGLGNVWNLIWNHYDGFAFPSYNIYRGTAANGLQYLTTISSGNNSYTDVNPPSFVSYYQVEAVNPNGCNPSRATDYSSSKSNIIQAINNSVVNIDGYADLVLYPNPVSKTLYIDTKETINEVMLFDALGHLVFTVSQPKNNNIDVSRLSSGVYIAKIKTDNGIAKRRWVKE